jgi:predicted small lipoprotein YifL
VPRRQQVIVFMLGGQVTDVVKYTTEVGFLLKLVILLVWYMSATGCGYAGRPLMFSDNKVDDDVTTCKKKLENNY